MVSDRQGDDTIPGTKGGTIKSNKGWDNRQYIKSDNEIWYWLLYLQKFRIADPWMVNLLQTL